MEYYGRMNESASPNRNETSQNIPHWLTNFFIAWFCTTSIVIVILNAGICVLFCTQRRLRITGNLFFANLAIADILVGFVAVPWKLLHFMVLPTPLWLFALSTAVDYVLSLSFLSICALTYDRYLAIIYPLTYPAKMSYKTTWKRLLLIWSLPCLNFSRLIWIISIQTPSKFTNYNKAFGLFHFSVLLLATVGIVFAYVRIFRAARRQEHHRRGLHQSVKKIRRIKFTKAIRCCLGVTVCFLCCWLPRGTYLIARKIYISSAYGPYQYDLVTFGLMCLSPVLNPIIYSFCNRDIRRTITVVFCRGEKRRLRRDSLGGSFASSQRTGTLSSKELVELSHIKL